MKRFTFTFYAGFLWFCLWACEVHDFLKWPISTNDVWTLNFILRSKNHSLKLMKCWSRFMTAVDVDDWPERGSSPIDSRLLLKPPYHSKHCVRLMHCSPCTLYAHEQNHNAQKVNSTLHVMSIFRTKTSLSRAWPRYFKLARKQRSSITFWYILIYRKHILHK